MTASLRRYLSVLVALMGSIVILVTSISAQAATTMTISPTSAYVQMNETQKITVKVNKKEVAASKCSFTSSNKSVATVSAKGIVTGKKVGTATITVTLKSNKKIVKKCKITVKPRMTLSASSMTLYKGYIKQLTVKINGKACAASNCTFTTSNKNVATVTSGGYVKGIKAGTATITVRKKSDKNIVKTCKVTVKNNVVKTDAASLKFSKGGTRTMLVTLNGANAGGGSLNFSSSNTSVATISSKGLITAKAAGTATITATCKNDSTAKATCKVTVISGKVFTVTPSDLPLNGYGMNFSTYNSSTRVFYMFSSYFRTLETLGGGTLNVSKGTYPIPNVLYVPSNVTVNFADGVVINKNAATGTSKMKASGSLFVLCAPSVIENGGKYSGYNGVHDVKFVGNGNVTINMTNAPSDVLERISFVLCHNKNISFSNIKFTGIKGNSHYIEIDASNNVTVENCRFENTERNIKNPENECINIDMNDPNTTGFYQSWSAMDCIANNGITIKNCSFVNVQSGLGTHSYTPGKYHTNIKVDSCTFENCVKYGINTTNWRSSSITNNLFNGIGRDTKGNAYGNDTSSDYVTKGIYVVGSKALTISGNTFKYVNYPMYFNCSYCAKYANGKYTFNEITEAEYEQYGLTNYVDMSNSNYSDVKVVKFGATAAAPETFVSPPHYYCREL